MAFLALNVTDLWDAPDSSSIRIDSTVSEANQLSYPKWERIRWQVPARNNLPPVTFTWHHGAPPDYSPGSRELLSQLLRDHGATDKDLETLLPYAGSLIVGSKGLLATNSHNTSVMLLPRSRFEDIEQRKPLHLPLSPGHDFQWIEACRGGNSKPISNFEYSAPFAEFLNVGSLSTRFPDVVLEFDPRSGRVLNHPEADARLYYPYRDGWTI